MTKTEPRSAGSGGGRDKTTPTELLASLAFQLEECVFQVDWREVVAIAKKMREMSTTLSAREDAAWELVRTEVEQVTPSVIVRTGMPPHDPPTYKVTRYWQATIGKRTEELTDDPTAAPKAPTAGEGNTP